MKENNKERRNYRNGRKQVVLRNCFKDYEKIEKSLERCEQVGEEFARGK